VVPFEPLRLQGVHPRRSQFVCRGLPGAAPRNRSLTTDDTDNADMGSAERSGRYNFVPFVIFCQKWNRGLSRAAPQQPKICPPNTQKNPKVSEGGRDHLSRPRLAVWTTLRCNNVTFSQSRRTCRHENRTEPSAWCNCELHEKARRKTRLTRQFVPGRTADD
jgi:hypothetical protein